MSLKESALERHLIKKRPRGYHCLHVNTLEAGQGHGCIEEIKGDYQVFSAHKTQAGLDALAGKHGLAPAALRGFVTGVLERLIFDGEQLSELFAPLGLGWKARSQAELA